MGAPLIGIPTAEVKIVEEDPSKELLAARSFIVDVLEVASAFGLIKTGKYSQICLYNDQTFVCKIEPALPALLDYAYKNGEEDYNEDFKAYEADLDIWESMGESLQEIYAKTCDSETNLFF